MLLPARWAAAEAVRFSTKVRRVGPCPNMPLPAAKPEDGFYATKAIAQHATDFLKDHDAQHRDEPFFLYLAFGNPHDPRVATKKYLDQYDRERIPLPKNFLPLHPFDNGEMT